ncbi:hypothetical protein ACFX1Q_007672 [Malus domestica]
MLSYLVEYCEWRWLISPLRSKKSRLFLRYEINRIKEDGLARSIAVVKHIINEGGKKRFSLPAQEMPVEKKSKTFFVACKGLLAALRLVIDLTSSKGTKDETARSEPVTLTMPRMTSSIVVMIA